MSRIGIQPIEIPEKVNITVNNNIVNVSGALGELAYLYDNNIDVKVEENMVYVSRLSENKKKSKE